VLRLSPDGKRFAGGAAHRRDRSGAPLRLSSPGSARIGEPASFHGASKVVGDMDRFVSGDSRQDCNRCVRKEALQVFSHNPLRVTLRKVTILSAFPEGKNDSRLWSIHEKRMPAWAFEIQTS